MSMNEDMDNLDFEDDIVYDEIDYDDSEDFDVVIFN